ncbi:DNA-binding protein inhibitor ID-4 [Gadus chalcogrammus]|uniref:DNA-binding protein inhibitor ID-4 n=1 Tax=Gadus chalcogrammus TaxID=1042646 RepID=UPI0024C48A01|nr:DNA-binding protein inhibitor ID-4 [Gadus chalcogrammus]
MKAIAPVRPQKDSGSSGNNSSSSANSSSSSDLSLHCLSDHSLHIARCRMEEEDLYNGVPYGDMNDCYSRLKRLVPTIPQDKKVSKVEILQHVIDYILDLQLALETHPSLSKQPQQQQRTSGANNPTRTPLTVLNIDHQRTSIVKKPEDSILCR